LQKYNESFRDQGYDEVYQLQALNDSDCEQLIEIASPSVVPHFLDERTGMYRGDICRVAALYLHGGYYFDLDMEVHTPYIAPSEGESPVFVTS
jgi:mannosyltransferase OCH1-like enzyme